MILAFNFLLIAAAASGEETIDPSTGEKVTAAGTIQGPLNTHKSCEAKRKAFQGKFGPKEMNEVSFATSMSQFLTTMEEWITRFEEESQEQVQEKEDALMNDAMTDLTNCNADKNAKSKELEIQQTQSEGHERTSKRLFQEFKDKELTELTRWTGYTQQSPLGTTTCHEAPISVVKLENGADQIGKVYFKAKDITTRCKKECNARADCLNVFALMNGNVVEGQNNPAQCLMYGTCVPTKEHNFVGELWEKHTTAVMIDEAKKFLQKNTNIDITDANNSAQLLDAFRQYMSRSQIDSLTLAEALKFAKFLDINHATELIFQGATSNSASGDELMSISDENEALSISNKAIVRLEEELAQLRQTCIGYQVAIDQLNTVEANEKIKAMKSNRQLKLETMRSCKEDLEAKIHNRCVKANPFIHVLAMEVDTVDQYVSQGKDIHYSGAFLDYPIFRNDRAAYKNALRQMIEYSNDRFDVCVGDMESNYTKMNNHEDFFRIIRDDDNLAALKNQPTLKTMNGRVDIVREFKNGPGSPIGACANDMFDINRFLHENPSTGIITSSSYNQVRRKDDLCQHFAEHICDGTYLHFQIAVMIDDDEEKSKKQACACVQGLQEARAVIKDGELSAIIPREYEGIITDKRDLDECNQDALSPKCNAKVLFGKQDMFVFAENEFQHAGILAIRVVDSRMSSGTPEVTKCGITNYVTCYFVTALVTSHGVFHLPKAVLFDYSSGHLVDPSKNEKLNVNLYNYVSATGIITQDGVRSMPKLKREYDAKWGPSVRDMEFHKRVQNVEEQIRQNPEEMHKMLQEMLHFYSENLQKQREQLQYFEQDCPVTKTKAEQKLVEAGEKDPTSCQVLGYAQKLWSKMAVIKYVFDTFENAKKKANEDILKLTPNTLQELLHWNVYPNDDNLRADFHQAYRRQATENEINTIRQYQLFAAPSLATWAVPVEIENSVYKLEPHFVVTKGIASVLGYASNQAAHLATKWDAPNKCVISGSCVPEQKAEFDMEARDRRQKKHGIAARRSTGDMSSMNKR